jgi:hypothetical protein
MGLTERERDIFRQYSSGQYKPAGTYTSKDLISDLVRMRNAWEIYQGRRDRDAIYIYLKRVFFVVLKWLKVGGKWPQTALYLQGDDHPDISDPFAIAIHCSSDPKVVDRKVRSKWSRALRFVHAERSRGQPIAEFMQKYGGVNRCAQAYTRINNQANTP